MNAVRWTRQTSQALKVMALTCPHGGVPAGEPFLMNVQVQVAPRAISSRAASRIVSSACVRFRAWRLLVATLRLSRYSLAHRNIPVSASIVQYLLLLFSERADVAPEISEPASAPCISRVAHARRPRAPGALSAGDGPAGAPEAQYCSNAE